MQAKYKMDVLVENIKDEKFNALIKKIVRE